MPFPRRHLLRLTLPAWAAAGCRRQETAPPTQAGEKHFIRKPKLEIDVRRNILPDPASGRKNLQIVARLVSREQLMELHNMTLVVLVLGRHHPDKLKPENNGKWRMILNEKKYFSLMPGQTFPYESPVIEDAGDDPWHVNHNIAYQGFVVWVENKYGEEAVSMASDRMLIPRFAELRTHETGTNFLPR